MKSSDYIEGIALYLKQRPSKSNFDGLCK